MNIIDFTNFVSELETFLREGISSAGDMADAVYIGEDIGRLLLAKKTILDICGTDEFWQEFEQWRSEWAR